jgi:hypothetical protein
MQMKKKPPFESFTRKSHCKVLKKQAGVGSFDNPEQ